MYIASIIPVDLDLQRFYQNEIDLERHFHVDDLVALTATFILKVDVLNPVVSKSTLFQKHIQVS